MMIQNKILATAAFTSALLFFGCSDDKSSGTTETGNNPTDYSSLLDDLNSDYPEIEAIKKKYGECDSKKDGLVVNDVSATTGYKFVCKDSSWKQASSMDFDEDGIWYHYGSCTDKEEGEIRLPMYDNPSSAKSHICKNHSWEEIQSSTMPKCDKEHLGQVIYLGKGSYNARICDEKKEWRDASIIEASWLYPNKASIDTVAGLCYRERNGEKIRIDHEKIAEEIQIYEEKDGKRVKVDSETDSELYYKCADNAWTKIDATEYTYGECKGVYEDSIIDISFIEKYYCHDGAWRRLDANETFCGLCTAEKEYEICQSPLTPAMKAACENGKWRFLASYEAYYGLCVKENLDEVLGVTGSEWDDDKKAYVYYTCDTVGRIGWRSATKEEILKVKLGDCPVATSIKVVDETTYFCPDSVWRKATELELIAGFCTWSIRDSVYHDDYDDDIYYICDYTKNGWKKAEPIEIENGICEESKDMETIVYNGMNYKCEDMEWKLENDGE